MTVFKKYNEGTAEWEAIAVGLKGDKGDPGDPGGGLPTGGTAGQYIVKQSTTDFDTAWVTPTFVDAAGAVSAIKADADWNATDWDTAFSVTSGLGTISTQDANSVNIDGGAIDATDIGVATPATVSSDNYLTADNYPTIKPSLNLDFANTKTLDPRVTFARASTATYYDGQTVAKAEENLLLRSQEFDNAYWSESASVNADATAAPDGTTTADEFTEDSSGTSRKSLTTNLGNIPADGLSVTGSIFVKDNSSTRFFYVGIATQSGSNIGWRRVVIDLNNGSVTENKSGVNLSGVAPELMESGVDILSNGWYRIRLSVTLKMSGTLYTIFGLSDSGTPTNDVYGRVVYTQNSKSCYIWGAQVEQRDSVTAYTPTTTQPITNYIPVLQTASSGDPRFDHDPITGESKGLLIEEQRTNLLLRSEEFDDVYWSKANSTIDSNAIVAPDGTLSADLLILNSGVSAGHANISMSFTSGLDYTVSVFAKPYGFDTVGFTVAANAAVEINLSTGVVTTTAEKNGWTVSNASRVDVGNGWYRVSATFTAGTTTTANLRVAEIRQANGDGFSGVFFWGAQLEEGSFPTSYIKTEGSQVTRVADSASMTGTNFSDWYRQDEGTFYADINRNIPESQISSGSTGTFSISDNTAQNIIAAWRNLLRVYSSNSLVVNFGLSTSSTCTFAIALKSNDYAISVDGATPSTDSSGVLPRVDRLFIGRSNPTAAFSLNGHIKRLAYYPQRLSNLELVALTEE